MKLRDVLLISASILIAGVIIAVAASGHWSEPQPAPSSQKPLPPPDPSPLSGTGAVGQEPVMATISVTPPRLEPKATGLRDAILGQWLDENGRPVRFADDGTYTVRVTVTSRSGDGVSTVEERNVPGTYRWLDGDRIEMQQGTLHPDPEAPKPPPFVYKVVVDGSELRLVHTETYRRAPSTSSQPPPGVPAGLLGEWEPQPPGNDSALRNNRAGVPPWVIAADYIELSMADGTIQRGVWKVDATKDPAHIDMTFPTGSPDGQEAKLLGLYRLEGDRLELVLNDARKEGRPTTLTPPREPSGFRVTLIRKR